MSLTWYCAEISCCCDALTLVAKVTVIFGVSCCSTVMRADDAMWARGRGWALSVALIALPYYLPTSPSMVRYASDTLTAVLTENEGKAG